MRYKPLTIAVALVLLSTALMLHSLASAPGTWTSCGLSGNGVHSIAISPGFASDRTLFAAARDGVHKSTDAGATWGSGPVYPCPERTSSFAVALSPSYTTDKTVFATTWGWGRGSVIKSTDSGSTWSKVSDIGFQVLVVSPDFGNDKTLFAASPSNSSNSNEKDDVIYKSTDGGKTWVSKRFYIPDATVQSIALSPNYKTDKTAFAGTSGGVVKTINGGDTWNRATVMNDKFIGPIAAMSNVDTSAATIFAGTETTSESASVYRSTNGGRNWTPFNTGLVSASISALAISPNYMADKTVFAATFGNGVYKSVDAGQTWVQINGGLTNGAVYDGALAISPNYAVDGLIYAGTYGDGVFLYSENESPVSTTSSTDAGTTSTTVDAGTTSTTVDVSTTNTTIAVSTTNTTIVVGTTNTTQGSGGGSGSSGDTNTTVTTAPTTSTTVRSAVVFPDVSGDSWYADFVSRLTQAGVMKGYTDGTFKPASNVTRAEFAKMICLVMGWKLDNPSAASFGDIPNSHWAYRYIETVKAHGAIAGYPDGTFKPKKRITRAEIAKMIAQTLNLRSGTSSLVDISSCWARDHVNACVAAGIINGYIDNTFKPDSQATRAEAAKMVVGVMDKK